MAKIDLDLLSIEELPPFREHATDKLFEKVAAAAPSSRRNWKSSRSTASR